MKDGVMNGTGNSRYLKSNIPVGTTWEQALAMLIAGTFPIDLNGINPDGWAVISDALNKANLLPDDVVQTLGLTQENPQVKDALVMLDTHKCVVGTYTGDGAKTNREINLGFKPELVILYDNPRDKYYNYNYFLMLLNDEEAGYAGRVKQSDHGFVILPNGTSANTGWNRDGYPYSFVAWR